MCKCGKESKPGQRVCRECHATYMRDWRKTHPMTEDQINRNRCRAFLNARIRIGKVARETCEVCGGTHGVEAEHLDFNNPYKVRWICRECRKSERRKKKQNIIDTPQPPAYDSINDPVPVNDPFA